MSNKVVTAITGGKDTIIENQNTEGAEFIAFTDQTSKTWNVRPPYKAFKRPVMNAKIHKVLIHRFVDAKVSMWIDGNIKLKVPLEKPINRWLGDNDLVVFEHPGRNCAYSEIEACLRMGRGNPDKLKAQRERYEKEGYPQNNGLAECNMIIRKHNKRTERFNEKWWAEICSSSSRDQISFPYVASKCDLKVKYLSGIGFVENHPYFKYFKKNHAHINSSR